MREFRLTCIASVALLGLSISPAYVQDVITDPEYTGPNRILSIINFPKANNFAGVPYKVTTLDNRGDNHYDKVMFHVDDFGQYLVVGARVMPTAGASEMDKDDRETVLRNLSEGVLLGWRADLGALTEITRETSLETEYGEALLRVYRVKKGSFLVQAQGRRPTREDTFDTNIASIVARQGAIVVFVLAQNDASPNDDNVVDRMARELFHDIRVLAGR